VDGDQPQSVPQGPVMRGVRNYHGDGGGRETACLQRVSNRVLLWEGVPEGGLAGAQGQVQTFASRATVISPQYMTLQVVDLPGSTGQRTSYVCILMFSSSHECYGRGGVPVSSQT
jgi:hypothetical protein